MLLASALTKETETKRPEDYYGKPPKDEKIQPLWDSVVSRESRTANFIGCGKIAPILEGDDPTFFAAIRHEYGEVVAVNPWILKFAVRAVGADGLSVDSGSMWFQKPIALLRGKEVVGMIMPMRFTGSNFKDYDLSGSPVPLDGGNDAVSENVG